LNVARSQKEPACVQLYHSFYLWNRKRTNRQNT